MAWTANVVDRDQEWVYLEFLEDGVRKFADKYRRPANTAALQVIVRDEIARLAGKAEIVVGPIAPVGSVSPDPDDTPKEQFLSQLQALKQLDKAIELPITTGANLTALQTARTNQLAALQTFYNNQTAQVRQKIVNIL